MSIKQITNRITDQWFPKLICLVIAIFLYAYNQFAMIEKKTFAIPLSFVEEGLVMPVGEYPASVSVVVRTSSNNMKEVSPNEMRAIINLNTVTRKGVHKIPVHVELSDHLLSLDPFEIRLKEEYMNVEVDKKAMKYVSLEPSLVGDVPHGYEITKVEINPSTVLITGPETLLSKTDFISTERINVNNAETTFSTETQYLEMTNLYYVENKGPYKATVIITASEMDRDFTNVPVEIVNLPEYLQVENANITTSLKLSGKMVILEKYLLPKHAVQLDMNDVILPGEYEIPVKITIPTNLKMVYCADEKITVNVVMKNEEIAE